MYSCLYCDDGQQNNKRVIENAIKRRGGEIKKIKESSRYVYTKKNYASVNLFY